jgi:hypothetical protein
MEFGVIAALLFVAAVVGGFVFEPGGWRPGRQCPRRPGAQGNVFDRVAFRLVVAGAHLEQPMHTSIEFVPVATRAQAALP